MLGTGLSGYSEGGRRVVVLSCCCLGLLCCRSDAGSVRYFEICKERGLRDADVTLCYTP